jgi:HlyD family secretion protein
MIDRRTGFDYSLTTPINPVNSNPLMKASGVKLVLLGSGLALALLGYGSYTYFAQGSKPNAEAIAEQKKAEDRAREENAGIGALGRLEPEGEVFKIAPPAVGLSSRVAKVLVKEGDAVKSGQPIAVMDTFETLRATGLQAEAQVRQAEAKLAQVKSGAKVGDINAQKAIGGQASETAKKLEIAVQAALVQMDRAQGAVQQAESQRRYAKKEVERANTEVERYTMLNRDGAISKSILEDKKLALVAVQEKEFQANEEVLRAQKQALQAEADKIQTEREFDKTKLAVAEAGQRLDSVSEVRPTDVLQAEEEVKVALANLEKAKADFGNAVVKSPIDAQIIKVHTKDNESVGNSGIMELGRTSQMYAIAEVDENLINRVKVGQKAIVKSDAFVGEITGAVVKIGNKVGKNSITSTDPLDKQDSRVVEVKVRLDSSELVRGLTNLQVKVAIKP